MNEPFEEQVEAVSEMLEALSDERTARRQRKHNRPLRGLRGVELGEVARVIGATWLESKPHPSEDGHALSSLFATAWEDGLVAIGLLAAGLPDAPEDALELGLEWAERIDDITSADALGWLVLGPGALACGRPLVSALSGLRGHRRPEVRRIAASAAMAATPAPVEGPCAAGLRARLGTSAVRFVDECQSGLLVEVANCTWRDERPQVRKAMRRLLRAWGKDDPEAVLGWADTVKGGLPAMLRDEVKRAKRKAAKRASSQP
jgi:hypothetical protein